MSNRIRPQSYFFSGSPETIAAASAAHGATVDAESRLGAAQAQSRATQNAARSNAQANVLGGMMQAPTSAFQAYAPAAANMFGTLGGMYNTGMGTMGQMFDSYADAFSSYGNAIGNIAGNASQARANENAGRYAAYAGGLDSYAGMMGNLGSSALAAYGSSANAAMQAAAAKDTAAMKAMADMVAANQAAAAQYGVGRDQSLAGIANAYAGAGGSLGNARANLANASANLAGAGSGALANLGTGVAQAAADASSGTAQGQAALAAALANALSGLGVGEQNALAQNNAASSNALAGILNASANAQAGLGGSNAALASALGSNITNAASNSLNYTRDMAKLGLARELGLASTNVASQAAASIPGVMGDLGGGFSITGPDGEIASGSMPGMSYGSSGISASPIYLDPNANTPWYAAPQASDGGAMQRLDGLQSQSLDALGGLAGDVRTGALGGQSQLGSQFGQTASDIGSASAAARQQIANMATQMGGDMRDTSQSAMARIGQEGDQSRLGILATLADAAGVTAQQSAGLDSDAGSTFGGIDQTRNDVVSSGVLDSLNNNFRSSYDTLVNEYQAGRQDPRTLLSDVFNATQGLASPYLQAGQGAYDRWMGNFPEPLDPALGGSGFLDPVPYLAALQAGWSPFRSELGNAFYNQNANVLGMLQSGRGDYFNSLGGLTDQFGRTLNESSDALPNLRAGMSQARLPAGTYGGITYTPFT